MSNFRNENELILIYKISDVSVDKMCLHVNLRARKINTSPNIIITISEQNQMSSFSMVCVLNSVGTFKYIYRMRYNCVYTSFF